MKTKKSTLYTIIALLIIFLPLSGYGLFKNITKKVENNIQDNPNHDFYYQGKLYFYDTKGKLLGKYTCSSSSCGRVKTTIDDSKYNLNYYAEGNKEFLEYQNDNYAFIEDGQNIILYSFNLNGPIITYSEVKDYHAKLENNYLIAKKGGKWGIIDLDSLTNVIDYTFDFIGLPNKVEEGILQTDNYIAFADNRWYILDNEGQTMNNGLVDPIVDFNTNYILTSEKEIFDYESKPIEINLSYKDIALVNGYTILVTPTNNVLVYTDLTGALITSTTVGNYTTINFEYADGSIIVYLDGTMGTSIDLNI